MRLRRLLDMLQATRLQRINPTLRDTALAIKVLYILAHMGDNRQARMVTRRT